MFGVTAVVAALGLVVEYISSARSVCHGALAAAVYVAPASAPVQCAAPVCFAAQSSTLL